VKAQNKIDNIFGISVLIVLMTVMFNPTSGEAAWYVTVDGNNNNDCLSILTPCATINGAISKAGSGDTIFIALGTFTGVNLEVVLVDKDVTLSGGWDSDFFAQTGMSTIDGQGVRRGMFIDGSFSVNVDHFILENGVGPTFAGAGGIYNNGGSLTLTHTTVTGNSSSAGTQGGGIRNSFGTLILNNSTVSNNIANQGAGIYSSGLSGTVILNDTTIENNFSSGQGGGIYNADGDLSLNNSAVINNLANVRGGGIYHDPPGKVTLTNSTLSGNTTNPPWEGGGLYHGGNNSIVVLNNSTATNNSAGNGGGIFTGGGVGSSVTLRNSIVAENIASTNPDCRAPSVTPTDSAGYNLIGNTSGCHFSTSVGDLINIDPLLSPLNEYGGPTKTHALLIGSPAIDAGDPNCTDDFGSPLLNDQRGKPRPVDGDKAKNDILVNFGKSGGLWTILNDNNWKQLHVLGVSALATNDRFSACDIGAFELQAGEFIPGGKDDVVAVFPGFGTWVYIDNDHWEPVHPFDAEAVVIGDLNAQPGEDIILDFGPTFGLWVLYDGITWVQLHPFSPEAMTVGRLDAGGKRDLIIDFGTYGLWIWMNDSSWVPLHPFSATHITTADIDNNGQDEVIVDFGPSFGIWIFFNNSTWQSLHPFTAGAIATGDLDNNGEADVLIDFPGFGLWVHRNGTDWEQLHPFSPELFTTGNNDNDSRDEVIVDFGPGFGIWIFRNNTAWDGAPLHPITANHLSTANIDGN